MAVSSVGDGWEVDHSGEIQHDCVFCWGWVGGRP